MSLMLFFLQFHVPLNMLKLMTPVEGRREDADSGYSAGLSAKT